MKIVQTFWSGNHTDPLSESYGWAGPEYHLFSWALSTYRLRQYYDDLVLYTDEAGKHLLIDLLDLPYTDCKVCLDPLNQYHSNAWALAKIFTYSDQSEPFLHVDGDVFIWKPFDDRLMNAPLIAQNLENGGSPYIDLYREMLRSMKHRHEVFAEPSVLNGATWMYNTGLFGGNDLGMIRHFCKEAFALADKNLEVLGEINPTAFSLFFEQYLFSQLAKAADKPVFCLFPEPFHDAIYLGFGNFEEVPYQRSYLHLVSQYKKKERTLNLLEYRLRKECPKLYHRILELMDKAGVELRNQFTPLPDTFGNFLKKRPGGMTDNPEENQVEEGLVTKSFRLTLELLAGAGIIDNLPEGVSINELSDILNRIDNPGIRSVFDFEKSIHQKRYESQRLTDEDLLERDRLSHDQFEQLFGDPTEAFWSKVISIDPLLGILEIDTNTVDNETPPSAEPLLLALIPEVNNRIRETEIDELDYEIIKIISTPQSMSALFQELQVFFDDEHPGQYSEDFKRLICERVKTLIFNKMLVLHEQPEVVPA